MSHKRPVKSSALGAREALKWLAAIPKQLPDGVRALNFFDLPPEIRNAIYKLALRRDEALRIVSSMPNRDQSNDILVAMSSGKKPRVPPASFLKASRKIHDEAIPILYGENNSLMGMLKISTFVSSIGSSTKNLRHVILQAMYKP